MPSLLRFGSGLRPANRAVLLATAMVAAATGTRLPAEGYDSWSKVESAAETREYGQQLKEGKFEAAQQAYISTILLPQLALPANRMSIGQVRQRIRDIATLGASQPQIFEGTNALIRDFMIRAARDPNADPLTRVNALMLVGELQAADRKPWKGAVEPLASAAADAKLPLELRIVAMAGITRHAAGGDGSFAAQAGPALAAIVTAPPQGDPAAVSWLLGRAIDILPAVEPPAPAIAALARIAGDESADIDLRVRAASCIAKLGKRDGTVDPAAMIGTIRAIAVAGLRRDLDAAEARRFSRQLAVGIGGADPAFNVPGLVPGAGTRPGRAGEEGLLGGLAGESGSAAPVDADAVPVLACRRNAWRLATLADAVKPEAGSGGIAALVEGDAAAAAIDLASDLRRQSRDILAHPHDETIKQALESLNKAGAAGAAAKPGGQPAAGQGDPSQARSPFDDPAAQ